MHKSLSQALSQLTSSAFNEGADSKFFINVSRIPLDRGGYDQHGMYYGIGMNLYAASLEVESSPTRIDYLIGVMFRAENYQAARKAMKTLDVKNLQVDR